MRWEEGIWKLLIRIWILFSEVEFVAKAKRCSSRLMGGHIIELITTMIMGGVLELFFEGESR